MHLISARQLMSEENHSVRSLNRHAGYSKKKIYPDSTLELCGPDEASRSKKGFLVYCENALLRRFFVVTAKLYVWIAFIEHFDILAKLMNELQELGLWSQRLKDKSCYQHHFFASFAAVATHASDPADPCNQTDPTDPTDPIDTTD